MPIPPRYPIPKQARCLKCGWKQTWINKTDTALPPPQECPKCGGSVECKPTDTLWAHIAARLPGKW